MSEITIPNISNYDIKTVNNVLIITPKTIYLSKDEFLNNDFTFSKILECEIKKSNNCIISKNKKYKSILYDIWKTMKVKDIIRHSTFNIKNTNEKGEKRYYWYDDLKLSIQARDSNYSIKEIFNMTEINQYKILLKIELQTGEVINYKNFDNY